MPIGPLSQRPHLDRAADARGRNPRRQLDRRVEVVGLEEQVAPERLLGLDEGAVGGQRLAVETRTVVAVSGGCIRTSEGVTPGVSLIDW